MNQVKIMCANIGGGKSTMAKKYVEKGFVVISRDNLRYAIGNGEYIFNLDYEHIIKKTEAFMLRKFLKQGVNIVIDACNVSKLLRKRLIDIIHDYANYEIAVIKMPKLSMNESIKRRLRNNHGDVSAEAWIAVWNMFNDLWEEPTLDEGIDLILTVEK